MKKILLLLSCFLATWCSSVQAQTAQPYGIINDASYDADNSQINAHFTSRNAYKVEMGYISQHAGSLENPLYKKALGVIDGATSWATIDVDPNLEEGLYVVLLYMNYSKSPNGGTQTVNVTAKGIINSVNVSGSNATANYKLWHGNRSNSTMKVFKKNANKTTTLLKTINLSNPNTAKNSTRNVSLGTYGDGEYTCVLYTNGRELHRKDFRIKIEFPPVEGEIKLATYTPQFNTLTVEYILKNAASANLTICDGSGREIKNCGTITNSSSTRKITIENVQYVSEGYYAKISATPSKGQSKTFTKFISMAGGDDGPAYANDEIRNMWYDSSTGQINVDFNLKTSGVNVQLQVVDTRSGGWITGRTWYCPQNCGSDFISVPSYNGTVMYAVILFVNGSPAASKQIMVSR